MRVVLSRNRADDTDFYLSYILDLMEKKVPHLTNNNGWTCMFLACEGSVALSFMHCVGCGVSGCMSRFRMYPCVATFMFSFEQTHYRFAQSRFQKYPK